MSLIESAVSQSFKLSFNFKSKYPSLYINLKLIKRRNTLSSNCADRLNIIPFLDVFLSLNL